MLSHQINRGLLQAGLAVLLIFSAVAAKAELVTWRIELIPQYGLSDGPGPLHGGPFIFDVTYDTELEDHNWRSGYGSYGSSDGPSQLKASIGDFTLTLNQNFGIGNFIGGSYHRYWFGVNNAEEVLPYYDNVTGYDGVINAANFTISLGYLRLDSDNLIIDPPRSVLGSSYSCVCNYTIRGRRSDGETWSYYRTLGIKSIKLIDVRPSDSPPVVNAGPDQEVIFIGETVALDGTQSSDPDGDDITYLWEIIQKPAGSTATLDNPTSPTPSFIADVHDLDGYVIQLTVIDENGSSASDTVSVSFNNLPPIADAQVIGGDVRLVGEEVCFDGSGSNDPNLDEVTFSWSISSWPANSIAQLYNQASIVSCFIVDQDGPYDITLIVNDGFADGLPVTATVKTPLFRFSELLGEAVDVIRLIPDDSFNKNNGKRNGSGSIKKEKLISKVQEVYALMEQQLYQDAYDKLVNDVHGRTDGCAVNFSPENNDWIRVCGDDDPENRIDGGQNQLYPILVEMKDVLQLMLP